MSTANGNWRAPEGFGVGPVEWETAPGEAPERQSSQGAGEHSEQDAVTAAHERQRALVRASLLHVPEPGYRRAKVHEHDVARTRRHER